MHSDDTLSHVHINTVLFTVVIVKFVSSFIQVAQKLSLSNDQFKWLKSCFDVQYANRNVNNC